METTSNPQLALAFEFIQHTNKNIFLTGKAGTGKTTFLHSIKEKSHKRLAVVAPTGVAAINAKGVTIHSLFQLPFGPILPGQTQPTEANRRYKFSQKKINLLRSLDLLIIDEISMVRADVLDGIDEVLRRYKDRNQPFGGLQLLMIGDLHQLPPVVKEEEWQLLSPHYKTPYFFGSIALRETDPIQIELKHIYRQSDDVFIELLNKVRNNQIDQSVLETLNSRFIADFQPNKEEPFIILTSHNRTANGINAEQLGNIQAPVFTFKAEVNGSFPEYAYPTEETLYLKKGAQVMFVKNDMSSEKLYFNGKIGQITKIEEDSIKVKCPEDEYEITVGRVDWENRKYNLNESTKEVTEEVLGTFTQFPLKLAWAITIHKSQGLTFEKAVIDAKAAFAHGQVYVALSRCKSFEGIVLRSKLDFSSIKTDPVVRNYSEEAEKNAPTKDTLTSAKKAYQESLVRELFNFTWIERGYNAINRLFLEHENTLTTAALSQFQGVATQTKTQVLDIAAKFRPQLETYFKTATLPEDNEALQERLQKASTFFADKLTKEILPAVRKIPILTDNKTLKKRVKSNLKKLEESLFIKKACFEACAEGFTTNKYMLAKSHAAIDFVNKKKINTADEQIPTVSAHPDLYKTLVNWRKKTSQELDKNAYEILHTRVILALTHYLPTTGDHLKAIKGIGKVTAEQYGLEIVQMIETYCQQNGAVPNQFPAQPSTAPPKPKVSTKEVSLNLYKSGKNIPEIATARSLTEGTIAGHLGHYISLGEVDIFKLMDAAKVTELEKILANTDASFSELKAKYSDQYSYQDMRMVASYLKFKETKV